MHAWLRSTGSFRVEGKVSVMVGLDLGSWGSYTVTSKFGFFHDVNNKKNQEQQKNAEGRKQRNQGRSWRWVGEGGDRPH